MNSDFYYSKLLTDSQSSQPKEIKNVLLLTAVKENWINIIIHFNSAIFFGLILLASGHALPSQLGYLLIHLLASSMASIALIYLAQRKNQSLIDKPVFTICYLILIDFILSIAWSASFLILFNQVAFENYNFLIALLLASGICSAALSAKLVPIMLFGRFILFFPAFVFILWSQSPYWILHSASIIASFVLSIGLGYAMHIQLLREACMTISLNQAKKKIEQNAYFREFFLKSITHDLQLPLSSINLFNHQLLKEDPKNILYENINHSLKSAKNILDNVSQLAWVSASLPAPNLQIVNLNTLLHKIVTSTKPLAKKYNTDIETNIEVKPSTCNLVTDPTYLERAIQNILRNAIIHSQSSNIKIEYVPYMNKTITIHITDNGVGIPQSKQNNIFQEYVSLSKNTLPENNLGLGLTIVKNIMSCLNGDIVLESQLGQGSRFSLILDACSTQ